jgi:Homeodomain-like domain
MEDLVQARLGFQLCFPVDPTTLFGCLKRHIRLISDRFPTAFCNAKRMKKVIIIMRATDPAIRKKVIAQYLAGYGRNQIARENNIGEATVTDILNRWKRGVDAAAAAPNTSNSDSDSDSMTVTDYESIRGGSNYIGYYRVRMECICLRSL